MIEVFSGANRAALSAAVQERVQVFLDEYGDMSVERIDGEETGIATISASLHNLPFLVERKIVVLRNPSANKEFIEKAEDILGSVPEEIDVVLTETKLDNRSKYAKFLKKETKFKNFDELSEGELAKWLTEQAGSLGGTLSSSDARYLIARVGANQQLLGNEIAKLVTHSPKVTKKTIDLLCEPTPQSSIFDLLSAALGGNAKKALQLYEEQRTLKVQPQQIVAMLAWQLHILALVQAAGDRSNQDIAKTAKINPYSIQNTRRLAKNKTRAEIKQAVSELAQIDRQLKSTSADADEVLKNFILLLSV